MEQMHGLMVPPCGHEFICRWVVVFLSWRKGGREKGGREERGEGGVRRGKRGERRETRTCIGFQSGRFKM